jgi:hypothetical protein
VEVHHEKGPDSSRSCGNNCDRRGGVAAGIIGGIAAGALIGAAANGYYGPGPVYYGPGCGWRRERFWDGYGWRVRRVRVCY